MYEEQDISELEAFAAFLVENDCPPVVEDLEDYAYDL